MGEMIIDDAYAELDRILPDECQPEIRIVWAGTSRQQTSTERSQTRRSGKRRNVLWLIVVFPSQDHGGEQGGAASRNVVSAKQNDSVRRDERDQNRRNCGAFP